MLERATRQVNGVTQVQYVYRYNGDQERVLKIGVGGSAKTYYVRGLTDVLSEFGESASGPVWSVDYVYAGSRLLAAIRRDPALPSIDAVTPSATSVHAGPQTSITWTVTAQGGTAPLQYQFWLYNFDTTTWTIPQPWGPGHTWTFTNPPVGHYRVQVWVRSAGSTALWEAWANNTSDVTVLPAITIESLTPDLTSVGVKVPVTWTAVASGGTPPLQYRFWLLNLDTMTWRVPPAYGPSNTCTFDDLMEGHYPVQVWVRSDGSSAPYEAWANNTSDVTVGGTENPLMAGGRPSAGTFAGAAVSRNLEPFPPVGGLAPGGPAGGPLAPHLPGDAARSAHPPTFSGTGRVGKMSMLGLESLPQRVEYYHLDALGSVRVITDETGAVLRRHDHQPFGEEIPQDPPQTPSLDDKRLFTGQERDFETALDYFNARYLGTALGRFTTPDPLGSVAEPLPDPQNYNVYTYAHNNPLRFLDPDGLYDFDKSVPPEYRKGCGATCTGSLTNWRCSGTR